MLSRLGRRHTTSALTTLSRCLSTSPPIQNNPTVPTTRPPDAINHDMAFGIQSSTKLFLDYGLGIQRLEELAKDAGNLDTIVTRWQRMMEAYLGTQVHVLAGLGYPPNESGLHLYNQHLATFLQSADPDTQDKLRVANRDIWRNVLIKAFDLPPEFIQEDEVGIVDARNMMHKVSLKMSDPSVLESIAKKCSLVITGDQAMDMQQKHQIVQETLVHEVYLGGDPTLVSECGFDNDESGYVKFQCTMAEHQSDPLIAKYVGAGMMQILKAAGLDAGQVQQT